MSKHHSVVHHSSQHPSQRMLRVAELVRHAMASVLVKGIIHDPGLKDYIVTIPRVSMSPDLKLATVYVLPLGGRDTGSVVEILNRHLKFIRTEVAHQINLKSAPNIRFKADDTLDNVTKIEALLHSDRVQRDLASSSV